MKREPFDPSLTACLVHHLEFIPILVDSKLKQNSVGTIYEDIKAFRAKLHVVIVCFCFLSRPVSHVMK